MRSRYSAFVKKQLDHIERTHAPEIRDDFNRAEAERLAEECEWQGLEIRSTTETEDTAEIEFLIRFRRDNKDMIQTELASFRRENGLWLYESGELNPQIPQRHIAKVGQSPRKHYCKANCSLGISIFFRNTSTTYSSFPDHNFELQ